jgi:hypothetical protein
MPAHVAAAEETEPLARSSAKTALCFSGPRGSRSASSAGRCARPGRAHRRAAGPPLRACSTPPRRRGTRAVRSPRRCACPCGARSSWACRARPAGLRERVCAAGPTSSCRPRPPRPRPPRAGPAGSPMLPRPTKAMRRPPARSTGALLEGARARSSCSHPRRGPRSRQQGRAAERTAPATRDQCDRSASMRAPDGRRHPVAFRRVGTTGARSAAVALSRCRAVALLRRPVAAASQRPPVSSAWWLPAAVDGPAGTPVPAAGSAPQESGGWSTRLSGLEVVRTAPGQCRARSHPDRGR